MHIMVADQDIEHRRSLVSYLQTLGHTPQEALTGREILDQCRSKCPHLIFIDKELSGTSGVEIIRQIRQLGGHAIWVPIVLTGQGLKEPEILQAIEAGADDFLEKPIPEIRLLAKIRSAERQQNLKDEVFSVAHNLVVANRALESLVTQDTLTGIGNSNSFDDAFEKAWFRAKRSNLPLTLIMANLDYFQAYNQAYGAGKGDETIIKVAEALREALAPEATIARLTGETFAILLPEMGGEQGLQLAEKLRSAVEGLQIPHINSGCSDYVTASFGLSVAEPPNYTTPWDLRESADFALFEAKHRGRNRVHYVSSVETKETN